MVPPAPVTTGAIPPRLLRRLPGSFAVPAGRSCRWPCPRAAQRRRRSTWPRSNRPSSSSTRIARTKPPISKRRSPIRSPASSWNGSSCAATTATVDFSRYAAFIAANPSWPSIVTLAPPRRGGAVGAAVRPANDHRLFRQRTAAERQGLLRARARLAGQGRQRAAPMRRCARLGAIPAFPRTSKRRRGRCSPA